MHMKTCVALLRKQFTPELMQIILDYLLFRIGQQFTDGSDTTDGLKITDIDECRNGVMVYQFNAVRFGLPSLALDYHWNGTVLRNSQFNLFPVYDTKKIED